MNRVVLTGGRMKRALLVLIIVMTATNAGAWWNEDWKYRKKITIDPSKTAQAIQANASDVPVLVRLHSGNFTFPDAKDDGSDIRFVASDDKTQLKHHIESYDTLDEMGLVWVGVPVITPAGGQNAIYVYYGNKDAAAGDNRAGTYDKNQILNFHFAESTGMPKDATGYENNASGFTGSLGLPAVIGKGLSLSGSGDSIVIQPTPSLNIAGGFTFSAWAKIASPLKDAYLFSKEGTDGGIRIGIDGTKLYCRVSSGKEETLMTGENAEVAPGAWHHLAVTSEHQGKLAMYIDGKEVYKIDLSATLPETAEQVVIGGSSGEGHAFAGDLDEVSIASVSRTKEWVQVCFTAQGPEGKLLAFSEAEKSGGEGISLGYMGIVLKNISIDGWVIIGICMFCLVICTLIFIEKMVTLNASAKANNGFLEAMKGVEDVFGLEDRDDEFEASPLYRVYRTGCRSLRTRLASASAHMQGRLSQRAINVFTTEMEHESVKESQRLNNRLVYLTLAIAGGPFLGLLGTVWGVTNTFASLAASGEANLAGIAPGVASALSATIAGLILAIPALFVYNYLVVRVKDMIQEMYVFMDKLTMNVEEQLLYSPEQQSADMPVRAVK